MYRVSVTALALVCTVIALGALNASADIEPGAKNNGLSAAEEIYLERYAEAQREFGSATVGANVVDDGTDKHDPYNVPDEIVKAKAETLGNWLRPPAPPPEPVESASYESEETYAEPTYTEPAPTYSSGVSNSTVMCESGGDYAADTGNGYYGGYQFDSSTWDAYGDPAYGEANEAPPAVQDAAAASVPYDAWPNC